MTGIAPLDAYVMDVSYFSGKLEAYLRYKGIPYRRIEVGWRELGRVVRPATGLMRVPSVRTADGQWLQDSTPMIEWFEERCSEGGVIPADPIQAFFSRLLEDYADEWLWRPALYYRWSPARDARLLSERIAVEVMKDIPGPVVLKAWRVRRRQRATYLRGDGVRAETREHVERVYHDTLDRLERILAGSRYLLGDRPSLADFGFFASMFRHFSLDPTPARIMRDRAPAVFAWVARLWNARCGEEKGSWWPEGRLPDGWLELLRDAGSGYLPYLHANAEAWREGRRRFDVELQGAPYRRLPTVRYRVWCRERLQDHFEASPAHAQPQIRATLEACGAWEPLWRGGRIVSDLHEGGQPPLCRTSSRPGLRSRLTAWAGDPWNPPIQRS